MLLGIQIITNSLEDIGLSPAKALFSNKIILRLKC
jgi:hypothetical protein